MARLSDWWHRVTGSAPVATTPAQRRRPQTARPTDSSTLAVTDEAPAHKPPRVGEAGIDPYASDAGYQKPHAWERLDHD